MSDEEDKIERVRAAIASTVVVSAGVFSYNQAAAFLAAYRECREIEREENVERLLSSRARERGEG